MLDFVFSLLVFEKDALPVHIHIEDPEPQTVGHACHTIFLTKCFLAREKRTRITS